MVFQSYALYPHMSVADNIAYGLKIRRMDKAEIDRRVKKVADMLELGSLLDRKPKQLSGGQLQRVAMGRAIVREPQVFLMDEPLSNLDAKLRVQMRSEIAQVQHDLNVTTIYVTHDQTEAMTMGDRVAVMKAGILQALGDPQHLCDYPANIFVAGFIGSPPMNMAVGRVVREDGNGLAVKLGSPPSACTRRWRRSGRPWPATWPETWPWGSAARTWRTPGWSATHPPTPACGPRSARSSPGRPDRGPLRGRRPQGRHRGHQAAGEGRSQPRTFPPTPRGPS
jgi:energy-coupling factor transporter ATP-binding protein EcfA2